MTENLIKLINESPLTLRPFSHTHILFSLMRPDWNRRNIGTIFITDVCVCIYRYPYNKLITVIKITLDLILN
jgi:hypothetical protein